MNMGDFNLAIHLKSIDCKEMLKRSECVRVMEHSRKDKEVMIMNISVLTIVMVVGACLVGIVLNRWYRQKNDYIPNPDNSPFRDYLEQQRRLGRATAAPWVTTDTKTLEKLQYLPEIVIPDMKVAKLLNQKVILKSLSTCPYRDDNIRVIRNLVVGGAPAAMVAMQTAIDGESGLYINYTHNTIAIADGAALHGEPQRLSDGPAYELGNTPLKFLRDEVKAFVAPSRYSREVVRPNLRWTKLGWKEWFIHPEQWIEGARVAIGNQVYAWHYRNAQKKAIATGTEYITQEIQQSGEYIKHLDQYLGGVLIQKERDSLLVTRTDKDEFDAQKKSKILHNEGCELIKLTEQEVKKEFGFVPRHAKGFWKKVGDFSFRKDFMHHLTQAIAAHGYEVYNNWQLQELYTDVDKPGGVAVFIESTLTGEKRHICKFSSIFLSLGITTYSDAPTPLASAVGVSCQGIISGMELKAGKTLVFGDTNHITPLSDTKDGAIDERTGKPERLTPIQYTNSVRVAPRDMGNDWAKFDLQYALHLDESIRAALPEGAQHHVVFCRACPRAMGPEGILTWYQIAKNAWLQMGSAGGGLTQAGRMARKRAKNPAQPIPGVKASYS